jgi:hypothetical protein
MKICKGKKKPAGRKTVPNQTKRRLPVPSKRNKDSKSFGKVKSGKSTGLAGSKPDKMAREGQRMY